ncbi:MAG: hypothetical protein EOL93_04045 [Epsilonproteobacteria bacterium]|nr:hypothetical protein [Campylobacterota bacterium]
MDNDVKVLEKIGLKEVSTKTHIEVKQLAYILNAQYDKLNRVNTLGFVKILSREYDIDFTEWLEGYHDYWAEQDNEEDTQSNKIFICARSDRSYKKAAWFFLLMVLIAGAFFVVSVFKIDLGIPSIIDKVKTEIPQTSNAYQSASVVKEATTSLGVKVEERIIETNSTNSSIEAVVVSIDENLTRKTESNESNATAPILEIQTSTPVKSDVNTSKAMILPMKRIWVGIVNLETNTRKESSSDHNITIDLHQKQIIKTGHGFFKLSYDGNVEDFKEQGSTRFLVENGTLQKISEEKFVELNRGKNW